MVAHGDRASVFQPPVPSGRIQGMSRRVKSALGAYEHMVPENDLRFVQDHTIHVHKEIFPYFDVVTVIAEKRGQHGKPLSGLSEQLPEHLPPLFLLRRTQSVQRVKPLGAFGSLGQQFRIVIGVV